MTIADLIKSTLRICHVLQKSEAPSADEMQDSVQGLQFMLDAWGADNLMIWSTVPNSKVLTAGKYEYTIGPADTNDIITGYPYKITSAFLRDGNNVDTGIDLLTSAEYQAYPDKALSSARPLALYYSQGVASQSSPKGTISLYPIPDVGTYTLYIECVKSLLSAIASTDTFTLLGPYEEAIKYNLAVRLWDEFHDSSEPLPQHILRLAKESKALIERNTIEFEIAPLSLPSAREGMWNILSDTET